MTEELWEEKPNLYDEKYKDDGYYQEFLYDTFEKDRDAWLGKVKDKLEWQEQHNKQMWMNLCIANKKLEDIKTHINKYPDVNKGACDSCPYPEDRKTREGACGKCAVGVVKFWLQDHKNILEADA